MRFIAKYLGKYKKESILAPLFKMAEAIFELLVPLVMSKIIDTGIAGGDREYVIRMGVILVILSCVGLISAVTAQFFAAGAAVCVATDIRSELYRHIMSFSDGVRERFGEAALITRLTNDVAQVQNGVNMFLRLFLRSPFIVFGAAIMAFTVSPKVAVSFLVVIPLLTVIVVGVMRTTLPLFSDIQSKLSNLLDIVDQSLSGVRVIRAFGQEDRWKKSFDHGADELCGKQLYNGGFQALLGPVTYITVDLAIVWILYRSGHLVLRGSLTTGQTVALVNYMSQILVELIKLANLILLITRAFSSLSRIEEVLYTPCDDRFHTDAAAADDTEALEKKPFIVFSDVSFSYSGSEKQILSDISFTLNAGETLGIIGGTGSGKTTLTRLLRHEYDATGGSIEIDGKSISDYSDSEISGIFGEVPQQAKLFGGTIRSNLMMGDKNADDASLYAAIDAACAKEVTDKKAGGLDAVVEAGGMNFSGGQRQRLSIARALVKKHKALILDDSASALDLLTEARLKENLNNLPYSPAKIIISQRASFVRDADKILVLEHGEVAGYGTHSELLSGCGVYREIYYTQFEEEKSA